MTEITSILKEIAAGRKDAYKALFPLIYKEFRLLAAYQMRRERSEHTLVATALVHEVYLKMIGQNRVKWNDRQHFLAVGSLVMRRFLVDHARSKRRRNMGSTSISMDLAEELGAPLRTLEDVFDLENVLQALEQLDARQATIVKYRVIGGFTVNEVAELLNLSTRTIESEWTMAKAWLKREFLKRESPP